jgi:hypothetical protein
METQQQPGMSDSRGKGPGDGEAVVEKVLVGGTTLDVRVDRGEIATDGAGGLEEV